MAEFFYKAYLESGTLETGTIQSTDKQEAVRELTKLKKQVLSVSENKSAILLRSSRFRVSKKIKLHSVFEKISLLVGAGLNIDEALSSLVNDEKNASEKSFFKELGEKIASGVSFSTACNGIEYVPKDIVALLLAGEESGDLSTVLALIVNDLETANVRKQKLLEAILYPAFLLAMMVIAVLIIIFVLVPSIEPLFSTSQKPMPFMIDILSGARHVILNNLNYILASLGAFVFLLILPTTRQYFFLKTSKLVDNIPFIGSALKEATLARFLKSLSLLVENDVAMVKALGIATACCHSKKIQQSLEVVKEEVTNGLSVSQSLENSNLFENSIVSIVNAGDKVNRVAYTLDKASQTLSSKSQKTLERLMLFLTPAITIFVGVLIGLLALSVMSAMLSINELAS